MNGFSWVIEGEIAGMARPGHGLAIWPWLAEKGIGLVVSLTDDAPDSDLLATHSLDLLHLPISDFGAPDEATLAEFLRKTRFFADRKMGIVVHCGAGVGRTGTMIACFLVDRGRSPEAALRDVRAARPGSVETIEQEQAVFALAETLE